MFSVVCCPILVRPIGWWIAQTNSPYQKRSSPGWGGVTTSFVFLQSNGKRELIFLFSLLFTSVSRSQQIYFDLVLIRWRSDGCDILRFLPLIEVWGTTTIEGKFECSRESRQFMEMSSINPLNVMRVFYRSEWCCVGCCQRDVLVPHSSKLLDRKWFI